MADFARVLAAVDQLLDTKGLARFSEKARTMAEDSLSADPFLARMDDMKLDFSGRAAELLVKVTPDEDKWRPPRDWPKGARSVTSLLKRHAPAMRKAGWIVEDDEDLANHFMIWTVVHPEKVRNPSPPSPLSPSATDQTDQTENKYGQSHRGPEHHGWSFAAALAQAVGVEGCPDCGEPLDADGLLSRCRHRHRVTTP